MVRASIIVLVCLALPQGVAAQHLLHGASGLAHGIPDLCASPTIASVQSGEWSNPSTWGGRTPTAGDRVRVSTDVTYDVVSDAQLACVGVTGALHFNPVSRLVVGTLLAYENGTLECGSPSSVCRAQVLFAGALDTATDPEQFGIGLVILGKIRWYGEPREPFVRLTADVAAGQQAIVTEEPMTTWLVGDTLLLPDTRQVTGASVWQIETRQIVAISGTTIGLSSPLTYAHNGAHDPDGTLKFAPHVANLTRTTEFRSLNPTGVRGHILAAHRAEIDIRYAGLTDLGRTKWQSVLDSTTFDAGGNVTKVGTNQIGKYALHLHHVFGPLGLPADVPQFTILGNAIVNSSKWGVTLHNSHYGLVQDNVIVNAGGAGIMTEDGSETANLIDHNFIVGSPGMGIRGDSRNNKEFGFEGDGIWLRGPRNRLTRNVSVDNRSFGISYFSTYLGNVKVPNFKGADPTTDGTEVDGNNQAVLEDRDNEVYGATENGMEYWWLGTFGTGFARANAPVQRFTNLRVWHVYLRGVWNYPSVNVLFDRLTIRGDLTTTQGTAIGWLGGDYYSPGFRLVNADIRGMRIGLRPSEFAPGVQSIEGGTFQNRIDILMGGLSTSAYRANVIPPRLVVVNGTRFFAPPEGSHLSIEMRYSGAPTRTLIQTDKLTVTNLNGVAGDNVDVYYQEQASSFLVPQTQLNPDGTARLLGAPAANLTNAQAWARFRVAIAGAVAPCTLVRPEIQGFVCPAGALTATSLTADRSFPVPANTPVTWVARATGGTGPYTFMFYVKNGAGPWTVGQGWSSSNTFTWVPASAGTYVLQVWIRNAGSTAVYDAWHGAGPVTITAAAPLTATSLTADRSFPVPANTPVTWVARVFGGTAPYTFKFYIKNGAGPWTVAQDWSSSNTLTWKPQSAGSYLLQVWIRNAGSAASYDAWRGSGPVAVSGATLLAVTGLSVSPASALTAGGPATIKATVSGGAGPYAYKFYVFNGVSWSIGRDWGPADSWTWAPPAAGTYSMQVWVRNAGSVSAYDAWKGLTPIVVSP